MIEGDDDMRARTRIAAGAIAIAISGVGLGLAPGAESAPWQSKNFTVPLRGALEVDGAGEPANPHGNMDRGSVVIILDREHAKVCWRFRSLQLYAGDALPSMGHIHRGEAGVNGDVEVTLFPGKHPAPSEYPTPRRCVPVERPLIREIGNHPTEFYVNLHNTQHPGGVMRGQLLNPPSG